MKFEFALLALAHLACIALLALAPLACIALLALVRLAFIALALLVCYGLMALVGLSSDDTPSAIGGFLGVVKLLTDQLFGEPASYE